MKTEFLIITETPPHPTPSLHSFVPLRSPGNSITIAVPKRYRCHSI